MLGLKTFTQLRPFASNGARQFCFLINRFGTVFSFVLAGMLMPLRMFAAFGLSDEGKVLVADSGAGLVFKVDKANGNIVSIRYKGGAELQEGKKGSHIASGLGKAHVAGAVMGGNIVKMTIATDAKSGVAKSLTHYLIVRKGLNNIYMATIPPHSPTPIPVLTVSGAAGAKANSLQ